MEDTLKDLNSFETVDFDENSSEKKINLNRAEKTFLIDFKNNLKMSNREYIEKNILKYKSIIIEKFIPVEKITFDSIIIFVLCLFFMNILKY